MTGEEIVRQARNASKGFQLKSRKFSGAMTAELMREFWRTREFLRPHEMFSSGEYHWKLILLFRTVDRSRL